MKRNKSTFLILGFKEIADRDLFQFIGRDLLLRMPVEQIRDLFPSKLTRTGKTFPVS